MEMITPNNLKIAQQELVTIHSYENGFEIPEKVKATPKDDHYHLIGVRSSDTADKFSKIYRAKHVCVHRNQYNKMKRQVKDGILKNVLGGTWQKVVILHDPTKPATKVEKKKGLSPNVKGKVKKLFGEGMEAEAIANELNQDVALVTAYIEEKLK